MAKFKINHGVFYNINNEPINVGTVWVCDDTEEVFADVDLSLNQDESNIKRIQISGDSVKKIRKKDATGRYLNSYIDIDDLVLKTDTLDIAQGGTGESNLNSIKQKFGIQELEEKTSTLSTLLELDSNSNPSKLNRLDSLEESLEEVSQKAEEISSATEEAITGAVTTVTNRIDNDCLLYNDSPDTPGYFDRLSDYQVDASNSLKQIKYNGVFRATRVYGVYYSDDMADLAEMYQVEGPFEKGNLIMICEDGTFRRNDIEENNRVLGIVSSKPAIILNEKEGNTPIALTGKVPVNVEGEVKAGDFLAGSGNKPGVLKTASSSAPRGSIVAQALQSGKDCEILAFIVRM